MSFGAKSGSFSSGTGTTDVTVTGLGFSPKAVIFWWGRRTETVDTVGRLASQRGFGFGLDSTHGRAVSTRQNDGAGTKNEKSISTDADAIATAVTAGTVDGLGKIKTMDADGFTIQIDDAFAASIRIHYLAIGGTAIENTGVVSFNEPSATGDQDITSLTFKPDAVILVASNLTATPPTNGADAAIMFGAFAGADLGNAVWAGACDDGVGTSQTISYCRLGECIALTNAACTATDGRASGTAFLPTGFRLNWAERATTTRTIFALAIKGPSFKIGSVATVTDTTTDIVASGLGFKPLAGLLLSHGNTQSSADTPQDIDRWSMGAFTGTGDQRSYSSVDADNLATSQVSMGVHYADVYVNLTTAGAVDGSANVTAVGSDGFTMRMTDADPSAMFIWYLAMGVLPATGFDTSPASNRPQPMGVGQLPGEPLAAVAVAPALAAWGYEPAAPGGRPSRAAPEGSAGQALSGAAVVAVTAWGYEPTSPRGRVSQIEAPFFGGDQPGSGTPAPGGFEVAMAIARASARPLPGSGEATTPGVFTATGYDPAPAIWRPTPRDPKFSTGEPYPPRVFPPTGFEAAPPSWRQTIAPKFFAAPDRFAALAAIVLPPFGFEPEPPRTRSPFADRRLVNGEPLPIVILANAAVPFENSSATRRAAGPPQFVAGGALASLSAAFFATSDPRSRTARPGAAGGTDPIAVNAIGPWFDAATSAVARARRADPGQPSEALVPLATVVLLPAGFEPSPVLFRIVRAVAQIGVEAFSVLVVIPPLPDWAIAMPGRTGSTAVTVSAWRTGARVVIPFGSKVVTVKS